MAETRRCRNQPSAPFLSALPTFARMHPTHAPSPPCEAPHLLGLIFKCSPSRLPAIATHPHLLLHLLPLLDACRRWHCPIDASGDHPPVAPSPCHHLGGRAGQLQPAATGGCPGGHAQGVISPLCPSLRHPRGPPRILALHRHQTPHALTRGKRVGAHCLWDTREGKGVVVVVVCPPCSSTDRVQGAGGYSILRGPHAPASTAWPFCNARRWRSCVGAGDKKENGTGGRGG